MLVDAHCYNLKGDTIQFAEYIERNLRLDQIRNVHERRPEASASWIRSSLASSLRSRRPYSVNILVGGFDISSAAIIEGQEELGGTPKLYWLDYLGTKVEVPFAAHGYGAYFALSLFDRCVTTSKYAPSFPNTTHFTDITNQMLAWRKPWALSNDASTRFPND